MLIQLLRLGDFYGVSENIEIAKGKNKIPQTFKEAAKQLKRKIKWQTRKQR